MGGRTYPRLKRLVCRGRWGQLGRRSNGNHINFGIQMTIWHIFLHNYKAPVLLIIILFTESGFVDFWRIYKCDNIWHLSQNNLMICFLSCILIFHSKSCKLCIFLYSLITFLWFWIGVSSYLVTVDQTTRIIQNLGGQLGQLRHCHVCK